MGCSRTSDSQSSPGATPATSANPTPVSTTPDDNATTRDTILAVDPDHAGEAATNLSSTTRCDSDNPGRPLADLAWTPATDGGRAQRVQVSIDPRGFIEPLVGPELPAGAASTVWTDIAGQSLHDWRILTEHDGKWVTSPTAQFEGPTCAIDNQPDR